METVVTGFEATERLMVGTIALALVPLWLLAVAAHLARPYESSVRSGLGVRLASEMWLTLFAMTRDGAVVLVFVASFIYFYPDVVIANDFPITGGVAATMALAVLTLKLLDSSPGGRASFRAQSVLLGLGAALYVAPYLLATQLASVTRGLGPFQRDATAFLIGSNNPGWSLALCAVAQEAAVILAAIAIIHTLRLAPGRNDTAEADEADEAVAPAGARELAP